MGTYTHSDGRQEYTQFSMGMPRNPSMISLTAAQLASATLQR